ncbi:MAG TPA: efflux RND transporter permease subunit [Fimbriimonadaceae bacterium]|nr:efflux RND transporter permease subunit [Fimbriimonadaceae bacterium]
MSAIEWLSHHIRGILLLVAGLCLLGIYLVFKLPVAIFPDLTVPRIIIAAEGGDAPAENILIGVTKPLEEAYSSIPGLKLVQSQTVRGSAGFTLTFEDGTDMDQALALVRAKTDEVRASLPPAVTVTAERLNPTVFPILDYSITSKTRSLADLRELALYTLRPRIARVPGVARVLVNGGDVREFQVIVSPEKLAAQGLSISQVDDAISKTNDINAVGSYNEDYVRYLVIVSGSLTGADSIRDVVVATKNRVPVTIGDLGVVREAIQRKTVIATGTGREAVLMNVIRTPQGNTVEVANGVRAEIASLRSSLPKDVTVEPFYDQSQIVSESESSVVEAITIGGLLALIVVALFLRNVRAAFVTLVMLPLTLLITFAALRLLHMTLNIMTLGAIAIALGLVIDDAIVVVEHIYLGLEEGHSRFHAVMRGLRDITPAMVGSSFATIVTFAPLMLLPGVTGGFFAPLALTLITMLVISLALSLTVVPLLARYIFPEGIGKVEHAKDGRLMKLYGGFVGFMLRRRWIPLVLIVPLAAGVYFVMGRLQTGFMPDFDEGAFVLDYRMPAGTSLEETNRAAYQVEDILAHEDGVDHWSRLTGALSGSGLEITALNQGDMVIHLKSGRRPSMDEIMDDVRQKVNSAIPNMDVDEAAILGDLIGDLAGAPSPVEVKIFGPDIDQLKTLAEDVSARIGKVKGVVDVVDGITESGPETMVQVDPIAAGEHGLDADSITAAAEGALDGDVPTNVKRRDILEPVRVMFPYRTERTLDSLSNLRIANPTGQLVPLEAVAKVYVDPGSPELDRENQRLMDSVTARLAGTDLGSAISAVKATLRDMPLPPGYTIEYGGLYKSQQESFAALGAVLITAGCLVFAMMVLVLRSFRIAVSLFAAAILSLAGVVAALWVTSTPLNISSYTGAIMIVGIVTENGILLFDEYRRRTKRQSGETPLEMLKAAGMARLRPILMTTLAAITALFPLALGIGAGAAMQKPLAIAVIGGLAFSTLFTLVLAPVLYATLLGSARSRKSAA